jgi:hypothetical protein
LFALSCLLVSGSPVTFSRKEWSPDFRRAIALRVPANIRAQEFAIKFKVNSRVVCIAWM